MSQTGQLAFHEAVKQKQQLPVFFYVWNSQMKRADN
jgi:hypothetical protein